ncbi:DUF4139 domain-containing protein [Jannaschia pohangensis]|uniref:DUF4139 domain-containing protein n=1 Tax=Jannaschia pohangensis TaxID=390807 RepID=A0A1I3UA65_9RHOB|nr:DUF4139 domain-containing protein [Jannaschia pohangensis]SFJ78677.1 conserved hypothetical protein [Jannaschia pohangensis]
MRIPKIPIALALLMPGTLMAEDFTIPAPVLSAVVFQQGALVTRGAVLDMPAGDHRILVPATGNFDGLPRVELSGAALGAVEMVAGGVIDGRALFTADQAAAHEAWRAATEAYQVAEDERFRAAATLTAAGDRLAFLRSMTGAALTTLDPATIAATADAVADGTANAEVTRADARAALRAAERRAQDASLALQQAKQELDATGADFGPVSLVAISAILDVASEVSLTLASFTQNAGWSTEYEANLNSDDQVELSRRLVVQQGSGVPMTDIALTLSTADPFARTEPSEAFPNLAQIFDPKKSAATSGPSMQRSVTMDAEMGAVATFAPEPMVVMAANTDGPIVTYDYPVPVSLSGNGQPVTLSLDRITLEARVFNRAIPRADETAYLVADMVNATAEPLLSGPVTLFREGARVGEARLPLMPAGGDYELAFGPQQHLRLEYRELENETGDRGIFVSSGTRTQDLVFRVRNLSASAEVVETRIALPFSEQETLEVTVTTSPNPDVRDVEDLRGVAQWTLDVAAGAEVAVEVGVDLEWPEGLDLIWQP